MVKWKVYIILKFSRKCSLSKFVHSTRSLDKFYFCCWHLSVNELVYAVFFFQKKSFNFLKPALTIDLNFHLKGFFIVIPILIIRISFKYSFRISLFSRYNLCLSDWLKFSFMILQVPSFLIFFLFSELIKEYNAKYYFVHISFNNVSFSFLRLSFYIN